MDIWLFFLHVATSSVFLCVCVCAASSGGYEWATAAWPTGQYGQLMNEVEIIKINHWVTQPHPRTQPPRLPTDTFPTHLALQRCTPCWCNRRKYFNKTSREVSKFALARSREPPWDSRPNLIFVESRSKTCAVHINREGAAQRGMGGGDSDRWTDVGRWQRGPEMGWWWIDRWKKSRRRRAAIRTKTSVTFWGFSLLPLASGPWSKPHRLYCVMVCVALCLCGPASGDWTNHDSAQIELHRMERSAAC